MPNLQRLHIIGHLGQDAEVKTPRAGGNPFTVFSVAVSKRNREGEDVTTWYNVTAFGANGKFAADNLRKGNSVYVDGDFQPRPYPKKDGGQGLSMDIKADTVQGLKYGLDAQGSTSDSRRAKPDNGGSLVDDLPF